MLEEIKFELEKIKNQYPEFFKNIPAELLELALSEEISSKIEEICTKNKIGDEESIEKVAYCVGLVLFGDLRPANLQQTLEKKLNISSFKTDKIVQEINRSIFYLIAERLEKLYEGGNMPKPSETMPGLEKKPEIKEKLTKPSRKDTYREPTE